jgi:predicted amidophosphoribosyltransferase
VYDDTVKRLVAAWKEHGLRKVAELAADFVEEGLDRPDAAAITFVPPDYSRTLRRGPHPAERLARELGERWDLSVVEPLTRARAAPRQRGLPLADRRRNVAGAYRPVSRAPRRIVLVDDVYTSGATVAAAASALSKAGARRIDVVTVGRAVR